MVYITPIVAGAVALSFLSSVSALPASQGASASGPAVTGKNGKSGPMVVQAKPMQTLAKKSFVGGGYGMKRLRQAPLMKPSRLAKIKRSLFAREEHVHVHEHDNGNGHHHADNYDPNHSEHWNYHHGRVSDDDKHHSHASRSLINIQALNLGSGRGRGHSSKKIVECSGSHFHCDNTKRSADDVTGSVKKLLAGKGSDEKKKEPVHKPTPSKTKAKSASSEDAKKKADAKHGSGLKNFSKTTKKHKGGKRALSARSHEEHYYGDGHEHEHDHEQVHVHEHNHKRDHERHDIPSDHSDHYYEHHGLDKHDDGDDHVHIHSHDHMRRQLSSSGVPGFVEVASTLFATNLAKSVAGLVFSKDPDANSSNFVLGTSDSQSTQFYLAPYTSPSSAGASPYSQFAVNSNSTNSTSSSIDPEASAATYQLRIPVLDSQSQQTNDYCATFDIQPPSPLSMQPCAELDGYSQVFGYNATTGELTPIYPASSSQPTPLNAAVKIGNPQIFDDAESFGNGTASALNGTATAFGSVDGSDDSSDAAAAAWSSSNSTFWSGSNSTSSSAAPSSTASSTPTPSSTPKVALYFIPSSAYYAPSDSMSSLTQAGNSSIADASSTVSAIDSTFTPAPAAIKAVNYNDGSNYDDGSDDSDDDDAVYTTVTITTTVSADPAGPTDSSDGQTFNGSSGRNNAVIADSPDSDGSDDSSASGQDGSSDQSSQDSSDCSTDGSC